MFSIPLLVHYEVLGAGASGAKRRSSSDLWLVGYRNNVWHVSLLRDEATRGHTVFTPAPDEVRVGGLNPWFRSSHQEAPFIFTPFLQVCSVERRAALSVFLAVGFFWFMGNQPISGVAFHPWKRLRNGLHPLVVSFALASSLA